MIVASFEYSVITLVNDITFTATIQRMAYVSWSIETVANEVSMALLINAALSDISCKIKWKWHLIFSENSWFPSEIQWYTNTWTGFRFWNVECSTKRSPYPTTIQISVGGIYLCDITNTEKQLCSPNEPFFVVLEKGFFLNKIFPFGGVLWDL